jgi:hypothetical protein
LSELDSIIEIRIISFVLIPSKLIFQQIIG